MRDVVAQLDAWQRQAEPIALATLVRVHGSAPRLPGARLCLTRSGGMAGSVSGGCVENDVFERALLVLDSGRPVVAHYGISDELGLTVGLSCGGTIDVLIEPFVATPAWQAVREAMGRRRAAALCIGLAPDALLARQLAVVDADVPIGSIDPRVDGEVAGAARALLGDGGTRVLEVYRQEQETTVFIEVFLPTPRLFVVGATHGAIPLCRMAKGLGFTVTVIDARGMFATPERFPEADALLRATPEAVLESAALDAYDYVVILTHDPRFDVPALACALRSGARYVGALGSRGTHDRRKAVLREAGFGEDDLARIRAPIGLDIGARTPEEIAVAIVAEMLAVRSGHGGRALSAGSGRIHGRR